jgi:hypothetical protein
MKITYAALAGCVAANSQFPEVMAGLDLFGSLTAKPKTAEEQAAAQKENTLWYAFGIKGYYTGFYKSFYKMELPETSKACLNKETMENVITFQNIVNDPMTAMGKAFDIQKDVNMFSQMAEIMENLSVCHFEQPAFDLLSLCTKDAKACDLGTITQNMSKDMFVLIGKMTSLAEIMQGFPAKDRYDFEEQMKELGATGGTWARVMFNFHHPGEQTNEHHYHHRSSSDNDY